MPATTFSEVDALLQSCAAKIPDDLEGASHHLLRARVLMLAIPDVAKEDLNFRLRVETANELQQTLNKMRGGRQGIIVQPITIVAVEDEDLV